MSNENIKKNIGHATSYGYAKSTGRLPVGMDEDAYAELMADYVTVGQTAVAAKNAAVAAKDAAETAASTATTKAAEAGQSATTATNAASAAQADADAAALDASQAMSAASTATTKAEEAATSATTATNAKDAAVTAKTAAQAAQTAAETAEDNAETSASAAAASAASVAGSAAQIAQNASDINELKEDFNAIEIGHRTITTADIIQGSYDIHGNVTTNTARIRTNGWLDVKSGEILNFELGSNAQEMLVGYFSTSKTFVKETPWIKANTSITIDIDGYLIIVFKRTDGTAIAPSDFDANVTIATLLDVRMDDLSESVDVLSDDLASVKSIVTGDVGTQYIDPNKYVENTRYATDSTNVMTASGYFTQSVTGLPSGTYYFRNIYTDFTHIVNKTTGVRVSLASLVGGGRVTGSVAIEYDYDLYVTANYTFDTAYYGKVLWSSVPYAYIGNNRIVGSIGIRRNSEQFSEVIQPVFYVRKDGSGDFTTVKSAIETAVQFKNAIVDIGAGTFDLIEEFGADYFANLGAVGGSGLQLYNDIIVRGTSNTLITCHYTGSNDNVKVYFSPFNLTKGNTDKSLGGFTLQNIHIECSNVRYAVHDESNASDIPYKNQYLNCRFKIDNRNNSAWSSRQCIGGGLGSASEIIIRDCIFESLSNEGASGTGIVSYHNGGTGRSDIVIKDCYFKGKDTVKASWHGSSTKVSTMSVSGCSMGLAPYNQAETSGDTVENMELITWNNEIRS